MQGTRSATPPKKKKGQLCFYTPTLANLKRKTRKQFHIKQCSKNKIPRNNFAKEVKDFYINTTKCCLKNKEELNKWKDIQSLWIGRLNIKLRWHYHPMWSRDSMQFPWKFICNLKEHQIVKTILKKIKVWGPMLPYLTTTSKLQ